MTFAELIMCVGFLAFNLLGYWAFVLHYGQLSLKTGPLEPMISVAISFIFGIVAARVIWRKVPNGRSEHP